MAGNSPIISVKDYRPIKIAVFESKFGYSVVIQRSFYDRKAGEWNNSSITLFKDDVVKLKEAIAEMEKQLIEKKM